MGRAYLFECLKCHYRAKVAGGEDRGVHCWVQTIRCGDCAALYDVPARLRVAAAEVPLAHRLWHRTLRPAAVPAEALGRGRSWADRLVFGGAPKVKWITVRLRCPVSASHRIELWRAPGRCPRCGTLLERALTPYRVWD